MLLDDQRALGDTVFGGLFFCSISFLLRTYPRISFSSRESVSRENLSADKFFIRPAPTHRVDRQAAPLASP